MTDELDGFDSLVDNPGERIALIQAELAAREKEALEAIKGDICDWLSRTLTLTIAGDSFLDTLDTGVDVCRLATLIQQAAKEIEMKGRATKCRVPLKPLSCNSKAKPGTFFARDNTSNFINWCRKLGVEEAVIFESEGLVLHRDEKRVILCLLDVARFADLVGISPPQLVRMEREIEELEANEMKNSPQSPHTTTNDDKLGEMTLLSPQQEIHTLDLSQVPKQLEPTEDALRGSSPSSMENQAITSEEGATEPSQSSETESQPADVQSTSAINGSPHSRSRKTNSSNVSSPVHSGTRSPHSSLRKTHSSNIPSPTHSKTKPHSTAGTSPSRKHTPSSTQSSKTTLGRSRSPASGRSKSPAADRSRSPMKTNTSERSPTKSGATGRSRSPMKTTTAAGRSVSPMATRVQRPKRHREEDEGETHKNKKQRSEESENKTEGERSETVDEKVMRRVNECTCSNKFQVTSCGKGKFIVQGASGRKITVYARLLSDRVMVRVGGGWDSLDHFLLKHDPLAGKKPTAGKGLSPKEFLQASQEL